MEIFYIVPSIPFKTIAFERKDLIQELQKRSNDSEKLLLQKFEKKKGKYSEVEKGRLTEFNCL